MPSVDQAQLFRSQDTRASFPSPSDTIALILAVLPIVAAVATDSTIDQNPEDKQGWYSAPNYRGTLDIVWPCLLTVFLCCWNAIHPDIPHPKSTWLQRFLDRTMCLFLGAAAPEMFVYFAYRERLWARAEYKKVANVMGEENWSIIHGFYAQMGGFAVQLDPEDDSGYNVRYADGDYICSFVQEGRISAHSWTTEQEIKDKGKADGLVKSLTILQLLWLFIQCSARLAQHLPLTTLEISTLAYIPCAISIYYFWWDKPYEINTPTYLSLAPEGTYVADDDVSVSLASVSLSRSGTGLSKPNESDEQGRSSSSTSRPTSLESTASSTKSSVDCSEAHTESHTSYASSDYLQVYRISGMIRQFSEDTYYFETYGHVFMTGATFFMVGAVHLSAWNFSFATTYERTAWRVCSIVVMFSIPLTWISILMLGGRLVWRSAALTDEYTKEGREQDMERLDAWRIQGIGSLSTRLWYVFAVPYVIARLYLLVEVFVALRAAPKDVYRIPEWTNFMPHFG
jgi:hypothetical protein